MYFSIFKFDKINKVKKFTREEAIKSGRIYLNKCLKGLLIKKIPFEISKEPKISIIIPVYNSQNTIKSAIRSIQNQNMIDIEIILINDFSMDNSLKIIENLQKKDSRIKIMNNQKNMGILYSRCIGVLKSKGKYILNLDNDDMFFDEDVFDRLYQEAEKGRFDIISFMEVQGNNYYINSENMKDGICTHHPDGLTVYQPELSYYPLFKNDKFKFVDIHIWGKLFKTLVYKKAVILLGKKRYSVFNTINEDIIALFAICNVAQSYKYIRKYGLFHFYNSRTASRMATKGHKINMRIFFSDVVFDISKNNNKKYAAILIIRLGSRHYKFSNNKTKENLFSVIKKILNCKFIEEKYKRKILKLFKEFKLFK
jgi:glycosyltransferase involved in cell wall biosynthesis